MANILHLEDEPVIRSLISMVLGAQGHQVTSAANLAEAQKVFQPGKFDLVITDYDLGNNKDTGLDFVAHMQAQGDTTTPVITCSSHDAASMNQQDARFAGFYAGGAGQIKALVQKPMSPQTLLHAVNAALAAQPSPILTSTQQPGLPNETGLGGAPTP